MYKYLIALLVVGSAVVPAQAGGKGHGGKGHGCYGGAPAAVARYVGGWNGYGCYGGNAVMQIGNGCYGGGWQIRFGCNGGAPIAYGCNGGAPIAYGCNGGVPTNAYANRLPRGAVVIDDKPILPEGRGNARPAENGVNSLPKPADANSLPPPPDLKEGRSNAEAKGQIERVGPPEAEAAGPAPATIIVRLPAEAKLTINKTASHLTSATRTFVSPPLSPGKDHFYSLEAELVRDGQVARASARVAVRAGEQKEVLLEFPKEHVATQ